MEMMKIKDLPDRPKCPKCGSSAIGLLKVEEEKALPIVEKQGLKLTRSEEKMHDQAMQTAKLIEKYGKAAAVALCARRIHPSDVREVLEKESKLNDRFYELVLEAERKAVSKRFW
jgi:ATP-dependent Lhr-like helicase